MVPGLVAGGAGLLIDGIGSLFGESDEEKKRKMIEQMLAEYNGIEPPTVGEQEINPEMYSSAGQITPDQSVAYSQGPTAYNDIVADQAPRDAQMEALDSMSQIGRDGGLRLSDKAALNDVRNDVASADKGRRDSILARSARRGRGGSGFELAAQLADSQASANRASDEGMKIAGMAQDNAMDAIANAGQMGGQIRGQDFSQAAAKAGATDAISRFNTQNQQAVTNLNTGIRNDAQRTNLTNRQNVSNANTGLRNDAQANNKGLIQDRYTNRLNLAGRRNDARADAGNYYGQQAERTRKRVGGVGNGVSQALYGALK